MKYCQPLTIILCCETCFVACFHNVKMYVVVAKLRTELDTRDNVIIKYF